MTDTAPPPPEIDKKLTEIRERDSSRQGKWLNAGEADRHVLLLHIDRQFLELARSRDEMAEKDARNEGKNDYYERQHYPRECPACNGLVTKATGYQCVDCDRWYHRECLRKHCAGELEKVAAERDAAVALLDEMVAWNKHGDADMKGLIALYNLLERAESLRAIKKQGS